MRQFSSQKPIAYFCAEYGLAANLPLYAGGLGVLAGDTLKQAADQKVPLVAVGLLYRGEGAIQQLSPEGYQEEVTQEYDPLSVGLEHVYLNDKPVFIKVHLTEVDVWVRCWQKKVGETVTLYLLDTDTDQNYSSERSITGTLYSGTEEAMMKQQLILGIGGVKLLREMGIHPEVYHVNEGRPAFLIWELTALFRDEHGLSYEEAYSMAKQHIVYTNHTLVGAAHQAQKPHLLKLYGDYYANRLGVSLDTLLEPGMQDADHFDLTQFAMRSARRVSAVSQLHYRLCKEAWPEYDWVGITNGVHFPTWQDSEVAASAADPSALWSAHIQRKHHTKDFIQAKTGYGYDPERLVVTWARRITGYKQLPALFQDIERLRALLATRGKEVQLIISGKTHMYDTAAKQVLQELIHHFSHELAGYTLFVPNYSIEVAQQLVAGSDVWLNTPEYGKEASGTSGMKAIANGVLQCTVADGWAAEVNWTGMGWTLDSEHIQDSFCRTMEDEVVPLFYQRDEAGIPQGWVERMQKSLVLSPQFSAERMLNEYLTKLY